MKNNINNILNGELVIFPTDTVYALACIPNKNSIDNIYILKKRDRNKKIIALLSDIENVKCITDENINSKILNYFMPGPLTIIVKSNKKFKNLIGDTIGFRIPNSEFARNLIRECGGILMTTSANISGEKSAIKIEDISKELIYKINNILDNKEILSGIPSTIISFIDGKYSLIREGEIKFDEILKIGGINIEK